MTLSQEKANEKPLVSVKAPDSKTIEAWESWVSESGLVTVRQTDQSDIVLWIAPEEAELSETVIPSHMIVCIGKKEIETMCQNANITFLSAEDIDSEKIISSIMETSERRSLKKEPIILPPNNAELRETQTDLRPMQTLRGATESIEIPERRNHTARHFQNDGSQNITATIRHDFYTEDFAEDHQERNFSHGDIELKKTTSKAPPRSIANSDFIDDEEGKTILLGFSKDSGENRKMQTLIETTTGGKYRIGATATSWRELQLLLRQGEFDMVLVYKKMADLENNLIDNMRSLRKVLVGRGDLKTRVILFEKNSQSDDFSIAAKGTLDSSDIEWQTVQKLKDLPECLMNQEKEEGLFEIESTDEVMPVKISHAVVHKPLLIATHSSGGGVGKSTSAVQLAFYYRNKGYKTLLLELDQDKPSIARCTGIPKGTAGLTGWTKEDFKTEDSALLAIKRTSSYKKGLAVLPVSPISSSRQLLPFNDYTSSEIDTMVRTLLRAAQKEYQIVIVDTNPILDDAAVATILHQADVILYLMEATYIFLDSVCGYLNISQQLYMDKKTKYIINKYSKEDPVPVKEIEETLETDVFQIVPLDVNGYRHAAFKAKPYKPKKGASPWDEVAENILKSCQISVVMNDAKKGLFNKLFSFKRKNAG